MTNLKVTEENTKHEATVEKEFETSVNLLPDENIEFTKRGIIFTGKLTSQSTGLVVLTNRRIIFLMHHFFGPDKLLYIPLNAISKMNFKTLGFLRNAEKAISLEYDNTSIIFAIAYVQKPFIGLSEPTKTLDFYTLLKEKLPECTTDETDIPTKNWDNYLSLGGMVIGSIIGVITGGFIGGLLMIFLFGVIGNIIGKIINKLTK
ncbi:PH domain-containing protein [Methanoregula sp.]|jgi:hypothetical protein|uniref:PH domain-containing protein n=1 Tax=Methanoregula sp. TaxID=2052170 RepID=UPI003C264C84